MKKIIVLLSVLVITITANAKRIILPTGSFYYPNAMSICSAGDTLVISKGNYGECVLYDLQGTAEKPIIITNDGPVKMGWGKETRYGLSMKGKYFKIIGDKNYGFQFTCPEPGVFSGTSIDFNNSSNYEVAYLDIGYTQLGLRSNPTTGDLMENINIHDIHFHNTGNPGYDQNRCEAIYFGNTDQTYTSVNAPMRFKNLHIHHCLFDSLMGDGIQIAMAESFHMDHDTVTNGGLNNLDGQFTCFLAGGCTQGTIDSCEAMNCNGPGVQVFGYGKVYITDNKFIHCGQFSGNDQDIIYISAKCPDAASLQTFITGNYIDGGNRYGINNETEPDKYVTGVIKNNTIKNTLLAAYSPMLKEIVKEGEKTSWFSLLLLKLNRRRYKILLAGIIAALLLFFGLRMTFKKLKTKYKIIKV